MMCDNRSLYKTSVPSTTQHPQAQSTTMNSQSFPVLDADDEHRSHMSTKRKLSGLYLCEKRSH